jgi:hypothetical protein
MKMIVGTGVYADFPTINGNIYTKGLIQKVISDEQFRQHLTDGKIMGGIMDPGSCKPMNDVITHRVLNVALHNDEIVVEIDIINPEPVKNLKHPQAAIVLTSPQMRRSGQTYTEEAEFHQVKAVHLRENAAYKEKS